uniref:Uncharacterized protein n=2 Tax=Anguilla anguilla TaxID=7936 RepID=A0A0E9TZN3_ANGAN
MTEYTLQIHCLLHALLICSISVCTHCRAVVPTV